MASIRKRATHDGSTRYVVLYRDREGRQRSETFPTRKLAEGRKSEVEVELRAGTFISPRHARETFGSWFARWQGVRDVSATRAAADRVYGKRVLARWESVPLDAITHMEAQAWVSDLSKELAPASVRDTFQLLRMPLEAAVRDGKIRANPVAAVKLPKLPPKRNTHVEVLTAEELNRLVAALPDRWSTLVLLTGWLGLRWSEALGLRLRDVEFLRKQLRVGTVVVVEVEGHTAIKKGGKTAAAHRVVPLMGPLVDALSQHIARFRAQAGPDDFLFVTETGTAPLRSNFARQVLRPALKRCGLDGRDITMRQLSHTGASLMLDAGLDVQDVARRMGHSRPSITYDVYAHLLAARQDSGTQALEERMRQAMQ